MIDLIIVLLFVAYAIYSGFSSKDEAGKDLREYFLAGRTLKGWKAGVSMAATQFAADTPLLVTGLIATGGIFLLWRLWVYGLAFLFMGFLFSTKWRRSGVITDAELVEIRYSGKGVTFLRVLKAVYYGTMINCTVMAMVLIAAMRISEVFLLWDQWLPSGIYQPMYNLVDASGLTVGDFREGVDLVAQTTNNLISIIAILGFTALYSTTGGLRSVVATDVMQFGFAMVGTLFYAGYILFETGGFGNTIEKVEQLYGQRAEQMLSFTPGAGDLLFPFLVIISLQWLFQMYSDGTGYLAQRSIACRTDNDARVAAVIFTWLQILVRSLIWLIIGVGILVLYPFEIADLGNAGFAAEREMLFVSGINDLLPPGVKGIMLTGLLGALASTLDTHLNWGSSYWSNDIYGDLVCRKILKRESKNTELVWVARFSNLLILTIAMIIMFNLGSIQEAWNMSLLFGAGMGSVLVLRWLWEKVNLYGEISAIASSLIMAPTILYFFDQDWLQLLVMSVVTTAVVVIVTYITPETDHSVLDAFYKKVKPQGFWRKTALRNKDNAGLPFKKFKKSVGEVFKTAISLFLLLAGFGKLMFRPESESIWWSIILIVLGLIMVPFWIKDVEEKEEVTESP